MCVCKIVKNIKKKFINFTDNINFYLTDFCVGIGGRCGAADLLLVPLLVIPFISVLKFVSPMRAKL